MSNPGKGDSPRPYNKKLYNSNFLSMNWKHNPRPASPFQCPQCKWWPKEEYKLTHHISSSNPIETEKNHFEWTETWKCGKCGCIFSFENFNF